MQNRLFLRVVVFFTPLSLLMGCSTAKNPVVNPGFESGSGNNIDGWRPGAWILNPDHVTFVIDSASRSGKQSAKVTNTQQDESWIIQDVPVREGRVYRISGWIKTENVQPQGTVGANLSIYSSPWLPWRSASLKGTQPWTQVEFYIKTSKGRNSLPIACRLGFTGVTTTGTAWFDDISVQEAEVPNTTDIPEY